MNPLAAIPGLGPLTDAIRMYGAMSEMERNAYLAAIGVLGLSLGYCFVKHPEILPESIKGVGEITKGLGEMIPL